MKTKTPSLYSAADVARVISRKLRKAGFLMADTSDRFNWTEGFHVHRIGCGVKVSVGYNAPWYKRHDRGTPEERERVEKAITAVREFLTAEGYTLDNLMYVECEGE